MAEIGNNSNVNLENLISLSSDQSILEERRMLELYELASGMLCDIEASLGDSADIYELLSLISDEDIRTECKLHEDALEDNKEGLSAYLSSLSAFDRALFCRLLIKCYSDSGKSVSEDDFLPGSVAPETFVYVRNSLSDEAFDVFSQELSDPRVVYSQSFKEAANLVSDGSVGYCLLPLEDGGDRLHTVDELIFSLDLKINGVTPVFGFDGMANMKYAMVGKYINMPKTSGEDDRYLEIRLPTSSELSLGELIGAAESFGHTIYRINTVTLNTDEGEKSYYTIVFRDNSKEFIHLLTYLTLFTGDFIPVGIYKNLE